MPTINDLQNLANGFAPTGSVGGSSQIIVTNNTDSNAGVCLPCTDSVCSVTPTQAITMDLSKFNAASGTKVRLDIRNTGVAANLTFLSNYVQSTIGAIPGLFPLVIPNAFAGTLVTVNGAADAGFAQQLNQILSMGSLWSGATMRFENTPANAGLENLNFTLFSIPVDPRDSIETDIVYDPFCDACFSTNNGNFTTHKYIFNAPITYRNGINILIPAGNPVGTGNGPVSFILEICYGAIAIPNGQMDIAANQMG